MVDSYRSVETQTTYGRDVMVMGFVRLTPLTLATAIVVAALEQG